MSMKTAEFTMFERMLLLPLFQGLTVREISEIVEWMKLDFQRHPVGDIIAVQDERCRSLVYVIGGKVRAEHIDPMRRFSFTECLEAPLLLEPYNVFGMRQNYRCTYRMVTEGSTLLVSKETFNKLLARYQVIRTNMLNLVCSRMQNHFAELSRFENRSVRDKILDIIKTLSFTNHSERHFMVKMEVLADMIGETRLNVSKELNAMCAEGMMNIRRGEIILEQR